MLGASEQSATSATTGWKRLQKPLRVCSSHQGMPQPPSPPFHHTLSHTGTCTVHLHASPCSTAVFKWGQQCACSPPLCHSLKNAPYPLLLHYIPIAYPHSYTLIPLTPNPRQPCPTAPVPPQCCAHKPVRSCPRLRLILRAAIVHSLPGSLSTTEQRSCLVPALAGAADVHSGVGAAALWPLSSVRQGLYEPPLPRTHARTRAYTHTHTHTHTHARARARTLHML